MSAYLYRYASPLGGLTLSGDGKALTGLWFDGQKYFMETCGPDGTPVRLSPERCQEGPPSMFAEAQAWLDRYFGGGVSDFTPPLRLYGTAFRKTVWTLLLRVPYGHTVTYGELAASTAKALGIARMSARAVGNAVGHNPVSLIVPCHRVVGAGGRLTGYSAGLDAKTRLLALEGAAIHGITEETVCEL